MSIPHMPPDVLAKLVLGYIGEEQLKESREKFLEESAHVKNKDNHELDPIFSMSLRSVVREYRAVKVYVNTIMPAELRQALSECGNLLELTKFLITNVNMNKVKYFKKSPYRIMEECWICDKLMKQDHPLWTLTCKHKFHKSCIRSWLKWDDTCPYCRKPRPLRA